MSGVLSLLVFVIFINSIYGVPFSHSKEAKQFYDEENGRRVVVRHFFIILSEEMINVFMAQIEDKLGLTWTKMRNKEEPP